MCESNMLTLQQLKVNRARAALGLPPYEFGQVLSCVSCATLSVFMELLMAIKANCEAIYAACKAHRFKHGLCLVAQFLREELPPVWDNFRQRIFECVCWPPRWGSSSERTLSRGASWASSANSTIAPMPRSPTHDQVQGDQDEIDV